MEQITQAKIEGEKIPLGRKQKLQLVRDLTFPELASPGPSKDIALGIMQQNVS